MNTPFGLVLAGTLLLLSVLVASPLPDVVAASAMIDALFGINHVVPALTVLVGVILIIAGVRKLPH